jgi:hypothetical protein
MYYLNVLINEKSNVNVAWKSNTLSFHFKPKCNQLQLYSKHNKLQLLKIVPIPCNFVTC